ncbi:RNA 3'-terminal phosphate cyclase [Candidatus Micrarchaeota archaeon]|nr:RNA 3'-terminal phosphate cyclase [Candidatus Micrarchaeota archaeon]
MIEIDGSHGSGGGQVLRSSLALSALTQKPFTLENIRAGRKNPGLAAQHLTCVRATAELTNARMQGAELGSTKLIFEPRGFAAEAHEFDCGTAGSVTLILQSLLPALAFANKEINVKLVGGTTVAWSPPANYFEQVLFPTLARMGLHATLEVKKWGWYPKGGGVIEVKVKPASGLKAIDLTERGALERANAEIVCSNLPPHVSERMKARALQLAFENGSKNFQTKTFEAPSDDQGALFFLTAQHANALAGFSALGERGKPAEKLVEETFAAFELFEKSGACVDEHLGDQLIPFLALARGESCLRALVTSHLLTNAWVCEQFLEIKFAIKGKENEVGLVTVKGVDF